MKRRNILFTVLLFTSFISSCGKNSVSAEPEVVLSDFVKKIVESTPAINEVYSEKTYILSPEIKLTEIDMLANLWKQHLFVAEVNMENGLKLGVTTPDDADPVPNEDKPLDKHVIAAQEHGKTVFVAINGDVFGGYGGNDVLVSAGVFFKDGKAFKEGHVESSECAVYSLKTNEIDICDYDEFASHRAEVKDAIGGWQRLVWDGKAVERVDKTGDIWANSHPRTFVAISKDKKKFYMCVLDGRQVGYSHGLDLNDITDICIGLGCDRACNLDGGGSSTLVIRDNNEIKMLNRPCDIKGKDEQGKTIYGPRDLMNGLMIYK